MTGALDARHKEVLSECIQSILAEAGERVTSATNLQSVFDSVISTAISANANYACGWNSRSRDNSSSRVPDELLVHCLAFLELADWLRATLVSHRWHKLVDTPSVWSKVDVRYSFYLTKDEARASWLSRYLAKSADASLNIRWYSDNISALEVEVLSANMHRTVHFETPHSMDVAVPSSVLGQRANRLETFSCRPSPGFRRTSGDVFDFEIAFGAVPHADLRKLHIGPFTLPVGSQCLPTVTDFEGILQADDASNLKLFSILPNLLVATLLFQTEPVIPTGPFPITLQELRFKNLSTLAPVATISWEPLLVSVVHPMRTISFDTIGNLAVPFELFKRAVPDKWGLVATGGMDIFSFRQSIRFTMTPAAGSTANTVCHSFCTKEKYWKSFVCSPSGAASVARNSLLVSLQLTPATFCALLNAAADLPALLIFTLFTSEGTDLPSKSNILSKVHSFTPIMANNLREFILEADAYAGGIAARWFTKFLPLHIGDMFKYDHQRLERLAFVAQSVDKGFKDRYAWGGVARLANEVHVGVSLDSLPLFIPNEADDMPDELDWEFQGHQYLEEDVYGYAYDDDLYDHHDDGRDYGDSDGYLYDWR